MALPLLGMAASSVCSSGSPFASVSRASGATNGSTYRPL